MLIDDFNKTMESLIKTEYSELIDIYNNYCENTGKNENKIYYMSDFEGAMCGYDRLDIIRFVERTHFDPDDTYFIKDSSSLFSFNNPAIVIDLHKLAAYITTEKI